MQFPYVIKQLKNWNDFKRPVLLNVIDWLTLLIKKKIEMKARVYYANRWFRADLFKYNKAFYGVVEGIIIPCSDFQYVVTKKYEIMKKLFLIVTFFTLLFVAGKAQNFNGNFISPDNDSLLIVIEPEQVVTLDTFTIGEFNHYGDSPYVGLLKLTTNVTGLYQFKSGQYYTKYTENGVHRTRWLGWLTKDQYLGNSVMRDSRGTRLWYLQLDEKGLPYRVELPDFLQPD